MSQSAKKKSTHRAHASHTQALPGTPWSPAGKALVPRASQAEKPPKPLAPSPAGKGRSAGQPEGPSDARAEAAPSQPQPIRAGQQALAALLSKQAAWEQTRSISLPPVLSQITSLLQHDPAPFPTLPVRSAQELISAAPQLGQLLPQPATAVERPPDQCEELQPEAAAAVVASDAAAVSVQMHDPEAVGQEAAMHEDLNLLPAKIVAPALKPSSSPASPSLKPEFRVSLAEHMRAALESEAQHAKRGAAQHGGKYFHGEAYFQETAQAVEGKAEEDLSHEEVQERAWRGAEEEEVRNNAAEEEALPGVWEEEVQHESEEEESRNVLETLCDAGEHRQHPHLYSPSMRVN